MPLELRLGTRGSQLALWQANAVAWRIAEMGGPPCRVVVIKTSGDRLHDAPLSDLGGKRLFVKEIEDALLRGDIDLAVHSSKDMPATLPAGLAIGGVLPREDPLDAVVLPHGLRLDSDRELGRLMRALGNSPVVGTGSVRRIAQLKRLLPRARFDPIRGNIDTRLRKLDKGEYGALVLAAAGLRRLGLASRISFRVPAASCVPAPGQGIVAIEIRDGDEGVRTFLEPISDKAAEAALRAERALVEALGGGCQTPIGALASPGEASEIELLAAVVALDGSRVIYGRASGTRDEATGVGSRVGNQLLADGAGEILADARSRQSPVVSLQSAKMTDDSD